MNRGERSISGNLPVSLYGTSYVPGGEIARDMAAIARVHPAAMGLVSYYYRLDKAITAFRKLMTRYEFVPKIEEKATLERQFRIAMLLLRSLLAVITEVSRLALQIRSGIVSKRKHKLYSFRTADIWHAPFGAAALATGVAEHPFLHWIEDVTLNIPRDRAESFQHFTDLCHSLIAGTTNTESYLSWSDHWQVDKYEFTRALQAWPHLKDQKLKADDPATEAYYRDGQETNGPTLRLINRGASVEELENNLDHIDLPLTFEHLFNHENFWKVFKVKNIEYSIFYVPYHLVILDTASSDSDTYG